MTTSRLLAAVVLLALPAAANAQSGDSAYCRQLANTYQRYVVGSSGSGKVATPDVSTQVAVTKCDSDAAGSIPIIEKALRANQIDLPKRN
jgi:hypothetical protein